jgi:hypothetical protein
MRGRNSYRASSPLYIMKLQFERNGQRIKIDARNGDNALLGRHSSMFRKQKDFADAAQILKVDVARLITFVDHFEQQSNPNVEYDLTELTVTDCHTWIRPLYESEEKSKQYENIHDALADSSWNECNPYIYWRDKDTLAAVDMDVSTPIDRIERILDHLNPVPSYAWLTHGGGLRLMYTPERDFTASEVASIAILNLAATQTYDALELKYGTRHPLYLKDNLRCGPVLKLTQKLNDTAVSRWYRQYNATDKEALEYLANKGLELGKRYDHTHCPIAPSTSGRGNPVCVNDTGIFCFVCQAHGIQNGFVPYAALMGGSSGTLLLKCVEKFTHYEHARFIIENKFGVSGEVGRLAYTAAMKLYHGTDARIAMANTAGKNLIRFNRRWTNTNGEAYKEVAPILETLPVSWKPTPSGLKLDKSVVTILQQNFDLSDYGYPHLTPIIGCMIHGQHIQSVKTNEIPIILQTETLARDNMLKYRPRYLRHHMPIEDAWKYVEDVFPGVSRNLIYLLIAAKGCMEAAVAMPPMIFITGPTGTSKSGSVLLAASICGDNNTEVVWNPNVDRIRQAIADGRDMGSYVTFNEIIKESGKTSPLQAMDFILNLTPGSVSHKMYVGPVKLGSLPVFVWTDTEIPHDIKNDAQLSRRLTHVQLTTELDWKRTLKLSGVGRIEHFRTHSEQYADASNAILSHVIDTYFRESSTFEEIADELGYNTLLTQNDGDDYLRYFFKLVCKAPDANETEQHRWGGRGWKKIQQDGGGELPQVWTALSDISTTGRFTTSRKVSERDWQRVVNATEPLVCEVKPHGSTCVGVRFISAVRTKREYRVNAELLNELEPRPVPVSDDRPRNAIIDGHRGSGVYKLFESLLNTSNVSGGDAT